MAFQSKCNPEPEELGEVVEPAQGEVDQKELAGQKRKIATVPKASSVAAKSCKTSNAAVPSHAPQMGGHAHALTAAAPTAPPTPAPNAALTAPPKPPMKAALPAAAPKAPQKPPMKAAPTAAPLKVSLIPAPKVSVARCQVCEESQASMESQVSGLALHANACVPRPSRRPDSAEIVQIDDDECEYDSGTLLWKEDLRPWKKKRSWRDFWPSNLPKAFNPPAAFRIPRSGQPGPVIYVGSLLRP